MKAKESFLDRNKKKSLLALLLLFLRQRKALVLLLLILLLASSVFVVPGWVTGLPGGARFAAGVAWIAGKLGADRSRWGLAPGGSNSYSDLVAAFKAAKAGSNGGGLGWGGGYMGRGSGAAPGDSLDMIKGSRSDLEPTKMKDLGGNQTIKGIVDSSDPKAGKGPIPVALNSGDLGGEREQTLHQGFAGFLNGMLGGPGAPGAGGRGPASGPGVGGGPGVGPDGRPLTGAAALSGGAYANKGFFNGTGGAVTQAGGLAYSGRQAVGTAAVPPSRIAGAANGKLSAAASRAVETRAMQNAATSVSMGGGAFSQLAVGNARDQLAVEHCNPPGCPGEYAATNTGAVYDGTNITQGFLTSSDPGGGDSAGSTNPSVDVPPDSAVSGTTVDPGVVADCEQRLNSCENAKGADEKHLGQLDEQINSLMGQMPSACGDPCNCDPCTNLQNRINGICHGDLQQTINRIQAPCVLPAVCSENGIQTPTASGASSGSAMCDMNFGQCGPSGFWGSLMCFLGS